MLFCTDASAPPMIWMLVTPVGSPTERLDLSFLNETLSRHETNDGRVGYGMHENLIAGLYLPHGFDGPDTVAP